MISGDIFNEYQDSTTYHSNGALKSNGYKNDDNQLHNN